MQVCNINIINYTKLRIRHKFNTECSIMQWEVPQECKRYLKHCRSLKKILDDTTSALNEINSTLQLGRDIPEALFNSEAIDRLLHYIERIPTLLIYGQSCHAKALFVNLLLQQSILPLFCSQWRQITFSYGPAKSIHLTLGNEIEIVENLKAHEKPWVTVPVEDLQRGDDENLLDHCPSLEVQLKHPLLKEKLKIMVPPDCPSNQFNELALKCVDILPAIIYAVTEETLSDTNIQEIRKLKDIFPMPFLFVSLSNGVNMEKAISTSLTESEKHLAESCSLQNNETKLQILKDQLVRLGYINSESDSENIDISEGKKAFRLHYSLENILLSDKAVAEEFIMFIKDILKSNILKLAASLSEIHNKCLKKFILCAFDMAREIQITPKRILYARDVELKLYKTLIKITSEQQDEITSIIQRTLQEMKSNVAEVLEGYNSNSECAFSLDNQMGAIIIPDTTQLSPKVATLEIQQLVLKRLSSSIGNQIVQSVGCLQESFTGTLQRCLESLEKNCHDLEGNLSASDAVKQIISATYYIDIKSPTSFSVVHNFMDRLRTLLGTFALPWSSGNHVQCNLQWQLQVVTNMIDSLTAAKLAKTVSTQFQEHINSSHHAFQSAMRNLESQLSGQLVQTEEQRIAIRKKHAPRFARLALESTSLCDLVLWGMPKQIKEIGRGQYGVVSSCEPWANIKPCAFKSVVPPDERHWNDLAMEFYYTRAILEHPRIVKLRGSVIDYTYGGGSSPAVLLIMERMTRDLYCGLRNGLSWIARLRIAIDVVEGIRYLHSQGLVHRDIKLKNVLLDNEDRAKLTDFGFCIPEAMMSGSIVGTPVHMAPELLSGRYDSSVDVYAFGILFWYLCAGQVRLPTHFDQFQNKEQLWNSVRKGIRPECLPQFDRACWNLMEQCWAAEPSDRPLLGYVQPYLESLYKSARNEDS
ncbi:dual serine/threonine and tyrosine protein kinase-like isoform X4 [Cylas formicarius]|uniref:dual serine/threonine and tyrosine protein kinase-like isoform X4 n=1 Tax=Cylas formicarius TaxID=197179 RepID=UPI002958D22C|nr:dual serine/threonine and tyrosine protein kinase-like isoform X4 [Cylas formicarius]